MSVLRKFWRLFVDDLLLAAAVPAWCLLCFLIAPCLSTGARAGMLFAGLAAALIASVARATRTRHAKM